VDSRSASFHQRVLRVGVRH